MLVTLAALASVWAAPSFRNGELAACDMNFDVPVASQSYDQANGSVRFQVFTRNGVVLGMGTTIKLSVKSDQGWTAPATAYLISDFKTNVPDFVSDMAAENPEYRLFLYEVGKTTAQAITFNGGDDTTIKIGFTVGAEKQATLFDVSPNDRDSLKFQQCIGALLKSAKER